MNGAKTLAEVCQVEEENFQFEHFSRMDALEIGLMLEQKGRKAAAPIAIEITVNGLVVFRYFQDGAMPDSALWLERKRRSVDLMQMSSLHFMAWMQVNGETMESRKLPAEDYAAGGGGFPVILKDTGMIGSICVSGCPNHMDDHQLIIDTLAEWFAKG